MARKTYRLREILTDGERTAYRETLFYAADLVELEVLYHKYLKGMILEDKMEVRVLGDSSSFNAVAEYLYSFDGPQGPLLSWLIEKGFITKDEAAEAMDRETFTDWPSEPQPDEDPRALFEAWASSHGIDLSRDRIIREHYAEKATQLAWDAFQLALEI